MATATKTARARSQKPLRPRGAARREALLEAVLRIVADVGADAVTHRKVAEEAGLPLASTTYWFDSKEHLLTAALEMAAERDSARLLEDVAANRTGAETPAELIDAAVATIVESCNAGLPASRRSLTATYSMLLEAARRPALREIAERWTDVYLETLATCCSAPALGARARTPSCCWARPTASCSASWPPATPLTCGRR